MTSFGIPSKSARPEFNQMDSNMVDRCIGKIMVGNLSSRQVHGCLETM